MLPNAEVTLVPEEAVYCVTVGGFKNGVRYSMHADFNEAEDAGKTAKMINEVIKFNKE